VLNLGKNLVFSFLAGRVVMPTTLYFINLLLIFTRILAVLATAPLFSNKVIPKLVKTGFGAILALVVLPVANSLTQVGLTVAPPNTLSLALLIAQEILIGVLFGFISNLVFVSIGVAASMIGVQSGFQSGQLFNPFFNASSSALDQYYSLIAIALFLSIDGHHWLIWALVRTFEIAPVGTFVLSASTFERFMVLINETFKVGVSLALPVVGTLLLTDIGLGLIARAVPQIQVFFVGLPLKVGLGFITLALSMSITLPVIESVFKQMIVNVLGIVAP
jgi:flagellar biosynthetic protein FliR